MNGIIRIVLVLAVVLAPLSAHAAGYAHGHRLYKNDAGVAYVGGYYAYNAYTYKWDWVPDRKYEDRSIRYSYTYNYYTPAAQQGASQFGVFRYDEYDPAAAEYDSQKYVAAARSVDERHIEKDRTESIQRLITRDKIQSKLSTAHATAIIADRFERLLKDDSAQTVEQFRSLLEQYRESASERQSADPSTLVASAESKCMRCHGGDATSGDGIKLPSFASLDDGQKKKIRKRLITTDHTRNMSVRAKLSADEQEALVALMGE